ncbi:MAG: adenine nucleotide alpha hydrolase [Pseudomonadota bacterium]
MIADRLTSALRRYERATVAVSGGVDSMTLAFCAHAALGERVTMAHAVSPAVPRAATDRVNDYAARHGWRLRVVDAREFEDERYLENPSVRCFFCKSNLYGSLARLGDGVVMSGTNTDDLQDWRPGLKAAAKFDVVHPFVDAGMSKAAIRALARRYDLADIADLPASPCLSSRVETGIRIDPATLQFIEAVETMVAGRLSPRTVRCRVRPEEVVVALDDDTLARLSESDVSRLLRDVAGVPPGAGDRTVRVGPYKRGDAFLR